MIYKGLRFNVLGGDSTFTISSVGHVVVEWPTGFTDYDRDVVESYLKTGIWVPVDQTSDFLKALNKHL